MKIINSYFNEDFIRIGAQVRGIKSGTINNFYINELFNSYEAKDIEKMMYRFIYPHKDEFKNSQVISPVFGVKRDVIYKKEYNELGETIDIKELDMEIKKTEEFLKQLKRLKDKLD